MIQQKDTGILDKDIENTPQIKKSFTGTAV